MILERERERIIERDICTHNDVAADDPTTVCKDCVQLRSPAAREAQSAPKI